MEKIRSDQSFLYRKDGLNCTVIDIRLKTKGRGAILAQALLEAYGLRCRLGGKVRFSTTKDRMQKTGRRQSERFRLRQRRRQARNRTD